MDWNATLGYFRCQKFCQVCLAATKVVGKPPGAFFPIRFLLENFSTELYVIKSSFETEKSQPLILGSACIYTIRIDRVIREFAEMITRIIGFKVDAAPDGGKPEGAIKKILDCKRTTKLGWHLDINLLADSQNISDWFGNRKPILGAI